MTKKTRDRIHSYFGTECQECPPHLPDPERWELVCLWVARLALAALVSHGMVASATSSSGENFASLSTEVVEMMMTRLDLTATKLRDRRVLIAGGAFTRNSAATFDPAPPTFPAMGEVNAARSHECMAELLHDARDLKLRLGNLRNNLASVTSREAQSL